MTILAAAALISVIILALAGAYYLVAVARIKWRSADNKLRTAAYESVRQEYEWKTKLFERKRKGRKHG